MTTKRVQRRRGTTAEVTAFTGAEGEIVVDKEAKEIVLQDGITQGGIRQARKDDARFGGPLSDTAPLSDTDTATAGTATDVSRADHRHPKPKRTIAATAPTVTDDETQGYSVWSLWGDTSGAEPEVYRCIDATTGAAKWVKTTLTIDELGTAATKDVPATGDAGTDEVVLGNDSRLTDDRDPKAHALAGADHSADTLANLNSKVSDATLDDAGDARTPTAHKNTHATGGSDALVPGDIGAEPAFTKNTAFNKDFGTEEGTVAEGSHIGSTDGHPVATTEAPGMMSAADKTAVLGIPEITNPKALSQAIHMTAAASGSNGIQVANNANINFGTGDFTLVWRGSLPDWTPSDTPRLIYKIQDSSNRIDLRVTTNGTLLLVAVVAGETVFQVSSTVSTSLPDAGCNSILASVTRESISAAGSVTFYVGGIRLGDAVDIPAAETITITNTGPLYVAGDPLRRFDSTTQAACTFNRALTAAEVLDLYHNGVAFADRWGSQTGQTSGTLTVGKRYRITTFVEGDDFTNVGAASNDTGVEFVATGTTPATWTNGSTLNAIGATLALEAEGIQPNPGQWLDSSSNKLHALQPAAGSSLVRPQRTFEVRWTNTWAGTHEAQYLGGVNQNILSASNIRLESITMRITGATGNVRIGDGSDTERFVADVAQAAYVDATIANRNHDGTNRKMVIDPSADMTGSIITTVRGIILD